MFEVLVKDKVALLALARERVHPRAELGERDSFQVTDPGTKHNAPYTWRCGYIGVDSDDHGNQALIIVDTQGDSDEDHGLISTDIAELVSVDHAHEGRGH